MRRPKSKTEQASVEAKAETKRDAAPAVRVAARQSMTPEEAKRLGLDPTPYGKASK